MGRIPVLFVITAGCLVLVGACAVDPYYDHGYGYYGNYYDYPYYSEGYYPYGGPHGYGVHGSPYVYRYYERGRGGPEFARHEGREEHERMEHRGERSEHRGDAERGEFHGRR